MASNNNNDHDRYKVEIFCNDNSLRTLGIPKHKSRLRVVEVARQEIRRVPTATHATVRALSGNTLTVYANDGWWKCQFKALKL